MQVDTGVLAHDMRYFAIAYALAIGAAFLPLDPVWPKWIVAVVLIGIYAWYVKGHFEADPDVDAEDLAPLRFRRLDPRRHEASDPVVPRLRVVNLQVLAALGLIIVGAYFFVGAVEHLATSFGLDEALLALVIAPIATELPEKFNSIIWVRQGKDTLAMGNITGAMVFQSTIPTVVALLFAADAWHFARGQPDRVRLGRDRVHLVGVHLHPDGALRAADRPPAADRRRVLPHLPRCGHRGADGGHLATPGAARPATLVVTPAADAAGFGARHAPGTPRVQTGGGTGRMRLSFARGTPGVRKGGGSAQIGGRRASRSLVGTLGAAADMGWR